MSSKIEREVEEVEEDVQEDSQQTPSETAQTETSQQPSEHPPEQPVNKPPPIPEYASKTVKKLSKDERGALISKFEKGEEDPYFKVTKMSNGSIRVTKRKNPIVQNVEEAQQQRSNRIANKVNHLTNEQLLMEHIIDLETRFESMRLKHKKLKKRYNELENSIYEDVDDHSTPVVPEGIPEKFEKSDEKIEKSDENLRDEPPQPQPARSANDVSAAVFTAKRRMKKSSWRDAVQYL